MAKQTGVIKISGCIDDRVFYQMRGQYYVRSRDVMRSDRIQHDAAFKKTRAFATEFSVAVKAANLFRTALRSLDPELVPTQLQHTITRLFLTLKNSDASSPLGERSVSKALQSAATLKQLHDFMRRLKSKRFDLDQTELCMAGDCLQIRFRGKKEGGICLWLDFVGMHFELGEIEGKETAASVWIENTMHDVLTQVFEERSFTEINRDLILDG